MWQPEFLCRPRRDHILPPSAILQPQVSPLLALPPELRNRIWHHLFLGPTNNIFHICQEQLEPPILTTCSKLRSEVSGIFYSSTILRSNDPKLIICTLSSLSSGLVECIPEIRYDTSETCTEVTSWRLAFRRLPGLDEDLKLQTLRDMLKAKGVVLRDGVLTVKVRIGNREVWTSEPLQEALEGVKKGEVVGRMMFV